MKKAVENWYSRVLVTAKVLKSASCLFFQDVFPERTRSFIAASSNCALFAKWPKATFQMVHKPLNILFLPPSPFPPSSLGIWKEFYLISVFFCERNEFNEILIHELFERENFRDK